MQTSPIDGVAWRHAGDARAALYRARLVAVKWPRIVGAARRRRACASFLPSGQT